MTSVKVSALPAAGALNGSETVPVVQGGATKGATTSQITAYAAVTGNFLLPANNLSDVGSAATARTSLGLGTAALDASSALAKVANNLSDLADKNVSVTNIGYVPIDGTAALASPSVVTRFRNLQGGKLYTTNLGIKSDLSSGMAVKLQDFVNVVIGEKCTGVFTSGATSGVGIDLEGAVIFFNATGTVNGAPVHGLRFRGEQGRYSMLKNGVLSLGTTGATGGDGLASGRFVFSDFLLEGGMDLWSLETSSSLRNVTIRPKNICTDGHGLNVYFSNHMVFDCVRVEDGIDGVPPLNGVKFIGCQNATWLSGGGARNNRHLSLGVPLATPTYADINTPAMAAATACAVLQWQMIGAHWESNTQEILNAVRYSAAQIIGGHYRGQTATAGGTWDTAFPLFRIQTDDAIIAQKGFNFSGAHIIANAGPPVGSKAIDIHKGEGSIIDGCYFQAFETAINGGAASRDLCIGKNTFLNCTAELSIETGCTFARETTYPVPALVLTDTSTINWNLDQRRKATLTLATALGRTLANPTNVDIGDEIDLVIRKSNASGNISTYGSMWMFDGTAPGTGPNFSAMTTTQFAVIKGVVATDGVSTFILAESSIKGT